MPQAARTRPRLYSSDAHFSGSFGWRLCQGKNGRSCAAGLCLGGEGPISRNTDLRSKRPSIVQWFLLSIFNALFGPSCNTDQGAKHSCKPMGDESRGRNESIFPDVKTFYRVSNVGRPGLVSLKNTPDLRWSMCASTREMVSYAWRG